MEVRRLSIRYDPRCPSPRQRAESLAKDGFGSSRRRMEKRDWRAGHFPVPVPLQRAESVDTIQWIFIPLGRYGCWLFYVRRTGREAGCPKRLLFVSEDAPATWF